jgi:hypothetical protein
LGNGRKGLSGNDKRKLRRECSSQWNKYKDLEGGTKSICLENRKEARMVGVECTRKEDRVMFML